MKKIRFIHTADWHLGGLFSGFAQLPTLIYDRLKESSYKAVKELVNTAIDEKVDFVIIAGDLYDLEERNLRPQLFFQKQMERLNSVEIPVYLVHGNHDFLEGARFQFSPPKNVHTFGNEVAERLLVTKDDVSVHLYGFSYQKRHIDRRMVLDYRKKGEADYHIGILHGNLDGETSHGNYAPFSAKELLERNFDYWALGHIHKRMTIVTQPPAVYPGCIQGRNRKETGEKGFYLVSLEDDEITLDFHILSDVIWEERTIDLHKASPTDLQQLIAQLKDFINELRVRNKAILLELNLDASTCPSADWLSGLNLDDLLEILQEEEEGEEDFVWIHKLRFQAPLSLALKQAKSGHFFHELQAALHGITEEEIIGILDPLLNHGTARKYVAKLDEQDILQLVTEAEWELIKSWNVPYEEKRR